MKIVQICAVYKQWPIHIVAQTDCGEFLEVSLQELKQDHFEFEEQAWKQLVEDYRVFHDSRR